MSQLSSKPVASRSVDSREAIRRFMAREHAHLDSLLARASLPADGAIDMGTYNEFRKGLLRHIGLEEKILLPAVQRLRGEAVPIAARLRLEHGAIASLLVPPPTETILAAMRFVLARHNALEEEEGGGLYAIFDEALEPELEQVLAQLRAAPEVPVSVNVGGPKVMAAARRSLQRAGFPESLLDET